MQLSYLHKHELWSIGMRGLATLAAVLLFWGTTAPTMFHENDIYKLSRFSGLSATIVLTGCFQSSYSRLLTPNLSVKERKYGYCIFWFSGTLFFNLFWQLPYLIFPTISNAPKTADGLYWKIIWWSYTLHDAWYEHLTKLVIAFEVWWLAGNIIGAIGLYNVFFPNINNPQSKAHSYRTSLLAFAICGALQCYNSTMYLFLSFYLSDFSHVPSNIMSKAVFLGVNGFLVFAPAVASIFASSLLLEISTRSTTTLHKSKTF